MATLFRPRNIDNLQDVQQLFVRLTLKEVGPLSGSVEVQATFVQAPS